jgi:hypothetical protein
LVDLIGFLSWDHDDGTLALYDRVRYSRRICGLSGGFNFVVCGSDRRRNREQEKSCESESYEAVDPCHGASA